MNLAAMDLPALFRALVFCITVIALTATAGSGRDKPDGCEDFRRHGR